MEGDATFGRVGDRFDMQFGDQTVSNISDDSLHKRNDDDRANTFKPAGSSFDTRTVWHPATELPEKEEHSSCNVVAVQPAKRGQ